MDSLLMLQGYFCWKQRVDVKLYVSRCAANSPQGVLRTQATMQKLQQVPAPGDGSPAPVLVYFSTLLEQNKLNKYETLELCKPVIAQQKKVRESDRIIIRALLSRIC